MSSEAKRQALLNEYKGYLFEYLVAFNLSLILKVEAKFLNELPQDLRKMLRIQEEYIREHYPELIKDLPVLAKDLATEISKKIDYQKVQSVDIVGKMSATPQINNFAEADLVVSDKFNVLPISLKLSKAHAYVNTKSGGVKSFLEKYFYCDLSVKLQNELNLFVDESFHEMAFELHELAGLEYPMHFKDWVANGLSELPGELEHEFKEVLHKLYYRLIEKIYNMLKILAQEYPGVFSKGVLSLLGLGDDRLLQATCFYNSKNKNYVLSTNLIENYIDIQKELKKMKIQPYKKSLAHFEIKFPNRILQVRIKPMNKFTTASFKINCSVKKL